MVESVDAGDSKSLAQKAWGFKSLSGHQLFHGSLAQLVEHLTFNQIVAGSNPAGPSKFTTWCNGSTGSPRVVMMGRQQDEFRDAGSIPGVVIKFVVGVGSISHRA